MAIGNAVTVTCAVAVSVAQPPTEAIVFVTVYVPAVLAAKFITPVASFILKPVVDVNAPATPPPEKVGDGLVALLQ